jgi:flagellar biosynthesis/type III secretory pathway M-ring protein FliF/YscJ
MPSYVVLLARWNALPVATRAIAVMALFAAVVVSIVAGVLAHPARVALFPAPLHAEQLVEVEERLAAWNVAFTPVADNVIVDAAHRNDLLLRLSMLGLPHAHVQTSGEALASIGVLTPQAVIDEQARAGLAGDIASALRGVEGIDDATVIIAPAKTAEFADEDARGATASVRLRLRAGAVLAPATVSGLRTFVAASVPGLDASRVTMLDDRGIALGARAADAGDDLQRALQSALDTAFGSGSTIVRVHESTAPSRTATAVLVDATHAGELASIRDLAAATVGYDARRGDTIAVQTVEFQRDPVAQKDPWWLLYGAIVPAIPTLIASIAMIVVARSGLPALIELCKGALERQAIRRASAEVAGFAPARVHGAIAHEPPHAAAAIISALPAATAAAVLELYPQHERDAIVARMQRAHCPLVPDLDEVLAHHA